ncbi:MAG: RluA family pseudouridine synthase [Clostridia bacterium]|nr:RluA family pseudouridine synthase [Clostridia bacterium]
MKEIIIKKNDAGQRLDKFLTKAVPLLPKSLMYKFIRTKKIKVNRKRAEQSQMLCEGDVILLFISDEFFSPADPEISFTKITPRIKIVYEDDDILLCNKAPGMSVIPDEHEIENTLINHIKAYLYRKGEYDPDAENSFAPSLCNRIDRNTGGIVIAAKNAAALRDMNQKIKDRKIGKKYLCIVHGRMEKREDLLKAWMIKDSNKNLVRVFSNRPDSPDARNMITGYRVIDTHNDLSLLEVELHTGRTHQIRAHMAHIGHPLLGDGKYGVNREDRALGYKYQALYSYCTVIDGKEHRVDPSDIWFVTDLFSDRIDSINQTLKV